MIRGLGRTIRWQTLGGEVVDRLSEKGPIIIAFWHGRQLMLPLAYRGKGAFILISRHRDGEIIHRIMSKLGFQSVRGSSTRGGAAALRQLIEYGRSGYDLALTPDGPKGPRQVVKGGVISLARVTGFPIVPLTFSCSTTKTFNSWDGFLAPYPLSRGVFIWGPPVQVSRDAGPAEREDKRVELETVLHAITAQADQLMVGHGHREGNGKRLKGCG